MGFYVNEFDNELKQHLNLSEQAWGIVYEDIRSFYYDKAKSSLSGFLNRIFYNFYQLADATISLRCMEQKSKLEELFGADALNSEPINKKHIELLLSQYKQTLISKSNSYSKGEGKKFRINKQNLEILKRSEDSLYYDTIGQYFKAVIEEYVNKKMYEREAIFFCETIDIINHAIQNKRKLKISQFPTVTSSCEGIRGRRYYVSPYKVLTDKASMFNYLICYAEELDAEGTTLERISASFRISRIAKIDMMRSMSGFISSEKASKLDEEIRQKTPQFMAGEVIDVKVNFTAKGLEDFERVVYLRPAKYDRVNERTFIFHCTELQARNYFFKFGKDAVIVEPTYLREKFRHKYLSAVEGYDKEK